MTQESVIALFLALFSCAVFLRCFLALSLVSEFAQVVLLDLKLNDTRATAISK